MCGRFTLTSSPTELARCFDLPEPPTLVPRYNIAPGQDVAVVRQPAVGAPRRLDLHRWGLVPPWAADARIGSRMINARCETIAERRAFRDAFARRRCLIPADGFFEWRRLGGASQPFYVRSAAGGVLAFAGIYERWTGAGGEILRSCALITTAANDRMRDVHDRMPVILAPGDFATWLDPDLGERSRLDPLLAPCPSDRLELFPVSRRVNDPTNDAPVCIEPALDPQGSLF